MQVSTLRPGLLVSLKTSITGNVKYRKQVIEPEHITDSGAEEARWETQRIIADPEEFQVAKTTRNRARSTIARVCTPSAFGLLCPQDKADELEAAIADARSRADEFNRGAARSHIGVYVITGRIAEDDVEAVRAINSEISELLEAMQNGIKNCDVGAIRAAAAQAKNLGAMLSTDASSRVQVAIDVARSAAKQIVKAGEQASQEVDRVAIARIAESRTAFLDLDEAGEVGSPEAEGRGIDLEPVSSPVQASAPATPAIDF